jgi:hypothetical protein
MSYDSQTSTILINKLRKDVDSLTQKIALIEDRKASGTSGGNGVAAVWTKRDLNTVASDPSGLILDLANSEFKLAAGAYQIRVISPFHHTRETRMRVYDVTNSVVIGYSASDDVTNQESQYLHTNVRITPHKDTVYRLEYYITSSGASHLGTDSSITGVDEIYTVCEITRLDTGATKPLGAGGLQGPQGPAGPTGPAGPAGPTGGGVTSVNVSGGLTGLTTSGGPITSSGTITLGGVVAVSAGGTGATTEAAALTSLGAYPASNPNGYTSNTGTVTSFGFTNANGVSGTVTNATSTPNLTVALGAITPTSVAASGTVTGSNLSGSNTGDQTITLTGDVTGSGTGSFASTIANNAVTFAKVQQIATDKILGRDTSGTGVVEELTVGGGVEFTGSGGIQTSAFTGDVTKAAGGTAQTIATSAVTYAKIQDISAASRLLGRGAGAGAGVAQEISLGTGLSMSGTTLSSTAAGSVTSVDASGGTTGLAFSGGPVTTTGTLTLAGTLDVANGGTGATTAAGALTSLGAYPNSNPAGYTANAGTVTNVSASGGANISVATGSTTPVISQVAATTTQNGYMTSVQATKLDGIAAGASVTSVGVDGGTTGLTTSGGPITSSGTITLAGTLAVANGGTGATSAANALTNLGAYPASNPSGYTSNAGTVTSVNVSGGSTGLTTSGGPVTASGTITIDGVLSVANGGTSSTSASSAISFLAGATTNGQYLRGNGTVVQMSAIQAVDLPQIALGGSAVSGTLGVINGGTGQSNVFSDGDLLIGKSLGSTLARAKLTAGANITITNGSGTITIAATGTGTGNVVGPGSATDGDFVLFDGTTGKLIKGASYRQVGGDIIGPIGGSSMIDGFVYIPAGSGAPTGTPTNVSGTNVPMFFHTNNSTNTNVLYIHNGFAWKSVALT